ncbi:acyl carrier protein [Herbaspirillum sp. NPDC087042]|uniref:acyl carrier protein n=1 Tax=Herbaspirillum sp. NPDC087042 TaxID=3364004 RepID=UPI003816C0C5
MNTLPPAMNKDDIYAWIVDMLHEMFELDKDKITPQSNLYTDLDIDSIDAVDIVVKLNQSTGKRIQPDVFRTVRTVQDVVDVLATLLNAGADATA